MAIQKVGVVGCGLMGSGIAQVAAVSGFSTVVREVSAELLDKGLKNIDKNLIGWRERHDYGSGEERNPRPDEGHDKD